jgi:hypothetical protein
MKTTTKSGLRVKTGVKAAGFCVNHNASPKKGLRVKTGVKAAGFCVNHNVTIAS